MVKKYSPKLGDIIFIDFDPRLGKGQAGRRPALVISVSSYNQKAELLVCCPITSKIKNYPFEVLIPPHHKTKGVILSDQLKSIDWTARPLKFIEKLNPETLQEVSEKISALLGFTA